MVAPIWSRENDIRLRELWAQGVKVVDLASTFGVSDSTVCRHAVRLKLQPRWEKFPWSEAMDVVLRENWTRRSIPQLATLTGTSVKSVRNRAIALGLPKRPRGVPPRRAPGVPRMPRAPKAAKAAKAAKQRVVATVFVAPRPAIEIHDDASAAEKLDAKLQRALDALRRGKDPVGIACGLNIHLREVYRLRRELRAA